MVALIEFAEAGNGARRVGTATALCGGSEKPALRAGMGSGGERRIDVARACGYQDGSAITHILKRLQTEAMTKPASAARMSRLESEMDHTPSCFKS